MKWTWFDFASVWLFALVVTPLMVAAPLERLPAPLQIAIGVSVGVGYGWLWSRRRWHRWKRVQARLRSELDEIDEERDRVLIPAWRAAVEPEAKAWAYTLVEASFTRSYVKLQELAIHLNRIRS